MLRAAYGVLGGRVRRHVPLGPLTTYGVGGNAALFLENCGPDELALARRAVAASGVPVLIIGRGSNLLVSDRGFPGLALTLGEPFAAIHIDEGDTRIRAGGAVSFPVLARRSATLGLRGLEWAVGVPGSVGGAVRMNAGGHGSDVAATLESVRVVDLAGGDGGDGGERPAAELGLGYRRSALSSTSVVVEARFALAPGDREDCEARIAEIVRWRREHQPGGQNAGSVFTNPPGDSAGHLVEAAGLKGLRLGSATVSPKHANFVQADERGSADDVMALIREVQRRVKEEIGVELIPELRMVGFGE